MRIGRLEYIVCLVFLNAAAASAQVNSPVHITSEEEATIYSTLSQGSLGMAPVRSKLTVGAKISPVVELQKVPETVPAALKGYKYTVHSDRVYIVDPSSRKVVRVIPNR